MSDPRVFGLLDRETEDYLAEVSRNDEDTDSDDDEESSVIIPEDHLPPWMHSGPLTRLQTRLPRKLPKWA